MRSILLTSPTMMSLQQLSRSTAKGVIPALARSITIGTDMLSSVISLQKSRPWYMSEAEGSNQAVDNAVTLKELFANKTVVMFGVPAPFTGTCSKTHYPPYKALADSIFAAGVDEIICYSVTDPYAHHGWQQSLDNDQEKIKFYADPDATFAKAYGVDARYDSCSLGQRSKRFSMIVTDGRVQAFREVTSHEGDDAANVLAELKEMKENLDSSAA